MARRSNTRRGRPSLPQISPLAWHAHRTAHHYLAHLTSEMGRLSLTEHMEHGSGHSWRVLRELHDWFDEQPSRPIAEIGHWANLNMTELVRRAKEVGNAYNVKPRIEITAEITSKDNLTVRWFPAGYRAAGYTSDESSEYLGSLRGRRFKTPPDFRAYIEGQQYASYRPEHELMFIRGVGELHPEPRELGPYATCNYDVLDALLICATRATFNQMIRGLREAFDVTLLNDFDFTLAEAPAESFGGIPTFTRWFVTAWRIVSLPDPAAMSLKLKPGETPEIVPFRPKDDRTDDDGSP